MNAGQLREVVHGLRRAADQPAPADVELLRRYAAGDEAAFELLVWRHAALVLGVCRRALGCPVGTVESRLTRARQRLREALVRRGFTVPAALASVDALATQAPAALVAAAVRGATAFITKQTVVSTEAALLAEGALRTMLLTRLRNIASVLAIALALAGAGIGWYGADAGEQPADGKVTERLQKLRP